MPKQRLTETAVAQVRGKPGKRVLLWDKVQPQLVLAVQPSGAKAYKLYYRRGGKPRWYNLGAAHQLSLAQARSEAKRLLARITLDETFDPQAERQEARAAGTWQELCDRYFAEYASRKNKSWRVVQRHVQRHTGAWSSRPAGSITRSDVRTLHRRVSATAPTAANQVVKFVAAIFSWAIREELLNLPANPAHGIEFNQTRARERIVSDDELPALMAALERRGVAGAVLLTILLSGQRPGEVAAMRWADIHGSWWRMPGEPQAGWPGMKNKQPHMCFLSEPVRELIERHGSRTSQHVFCTATGKPLRDLGATMRQVSAELELDPPVKPHDLRRTYATFVTRLGWDRAAMDRVLGHKPGGVGSVYDRNTYATEFQRIAEAVARELERRRRRGLAEVA